MKFLLPNLKFKLQHVYILAPPLLNQFGKKSRCGGAEE